MKNSIRTLVAALLLSPVLFTACKKESNAFYANGSAPVLKSSTTTVAPGPADSSNSVLTLSWSNPKYGTDSVHQKFIIEVDSTGRNFSREATVTVNGPLSYSFTGNQFNNLLANFGFSAGKAYTLEVRITSSYANNNEQYKSNVLTVNATPYAVPIKLNASSTAPLVLQISNATNNAISFTWNQSTFGNKTIDYVLQMDTVGGNFQHPQAWQLGTSLSDAINVNDLNTAGIAAGVIGGTTKNVEFRIIGYVGGYTTVLTMSPAVTINLTTYVAAPAALYIVGDATAGQWNNPVPTPSQQFTKINAVSFGIILNLTAGKSYLFLPLNGDWGHKFGGATDGTGSGGGTLLADGAVPGSNTPAPGATGLYEVVVNFQTNTYTVTPYTGTSLPANLYIVGDATAGQWNNPVPVPSQQFTQLSNAEFQITIPLTSGKSYLFLPLNGDWGHKFGGSADGTAAGGTTLLVDGAVPGSNTPAPATTGSYVIDVNFLTMSFTVTGP
jgi:starch-binding outer membrane protein SusE/F